MANRPTESLRIKLHLLPFSSSRLTFLLLVLGCQGLHSLKTFQILESVFRAYRNMLLRFAKGRHFRCNELNSFLLLLLVHAVGSSSWSESRAERAVQPRALDSLQDGTRGSLLPWIPLVRRLDPGVDISDQIKGKMSEDNVGCVCLVCSHSQVQLSPLGSIEAAASLGILQLPSSSWARVGCTQSWGAWEVEDSAGCKICTGAQPV